MAVRTLALYHLKGGVGKTAAAVNLAYCASLAGLNTLLVDLDPQSSATYYFRVKPKFRKGAQGLLKGGKLILQNVKASDFPGLDVLPADFSFRRLDRRLEDSKSASVRLQRVFRPLRKEYDLLIFDCPPSISIVAENIFHLADVLLVPVIPTILSVRSLGQMIRFFKKKDYDRGKLRPFFSMVERRKKIHRDLLGARGDFPVEFLQSTIPYRSEVERMGLERKPVPVFAAKSPAADAYRELWAELEEKYQLGKRK